MMCQNCFFTVRLIINTEHTMHKAALIFLLAVTSSGAVAEWTMIEENHDAA